MSDKKEESPKKDTQNPEQEKPKTCFVIMPISDQPGYSEGHFQRVYDYIIKPACERAGFIPIRADDIKSTNVIIVDVLNRIIESEMAICDMSAKNPNAMYELGIRQAFDKPVVLIKDEITDRIFDTTMLRDVSYFSQLRVDQVNTAIVHLAEAIQQTYENKDNVREINSIVKLMSRSAAEIKTTDLSDDTKIILNAISNLQRKDSVASPPPPFVGTEIPSVRFMGDEVLKPGDSIYHDKYGQGVIDMIKAGSIIKSKNSRTYLDVRLYVSFDGGMGRILDLDLEKPYITLIVTNREG